MTEKENNYELVAPLTGAKPLTPELLAKLRTPIDGSLVEKRPGPDGIELVYLEGFRVIDQHNEIWMHGNWWYQCQPDGPQHHVVEQHDPVSDNIRRLEYYSAVVTIFRDNVPMFRDEGFGAVDESPFGARPRVVLGNHKKARQGSITDGLKRASRGFGSQFGNSLYDDEYEREADPNAPSCPVHGAGGHVRDSTWGDAQYYCAIRIPEGGYCTAIPTVPGDISDVATQYAPSADGPVALPVATGTIVDAGPTKREMLDEYFKLVARLGFDRDVIRAGYRQKYGRNIEDSSINELGDLVIMAKSKLESRGGETRSA